MKYSNLKTLVTPSFDAYVSPNIRDYRNRNKALDNILDFLIETGVDLNEFNADDFMVNGLMFLNKEEQTDEDIVFIEEGNSILTLAR
jgi:hypothetical protein